MSFPKESYILKIAYHHKHKYPNNRRRNKMNLLLILGVNQIQRRALGKKLVESDNI